MIGVDYPQPIVDPEESRKKASDIVYEYKKSASVKEEGKRILKKHVTNPGKKSREKGSIHLNIPLD